MIEWEILEIGRRPNNSEDALLFISEWVGNGTEIEYKRSVATRHYIRRCQIHAGIIVSYSILARIIEEPFSPRPEIKNQEDDNE